VSLHNPQGALQCFSQTPPTVHLAKHVDASLGGDDGTYVIPYKHAPVETTVFQALQGLVHNYGALLGLSCILYRESVFIDTLVYRFALAGRCCVDIGIHVDLFLIPS
jgi:hypothetical protein